MKQANVQTARTVHQIPCRAAMNSVEWNPKINLLAYAGDDIKPPGEGIVLFLIHTHPHKAHLTDAMFWSEFVAGIFRIFGFKGSS